MSKVIHISHFVNPFCFYFKFDENLQDTDLQRLEDEIKIFARSKVSNETFDLVPLKEGDIVAAYEITWGKWMRAVVVSNLESLKRYQLWSVDHGKYFRSPHKHVIPLPPNLIEEQVKGIHRGSIYGVCPAKLEFNLINCETELSSMENWSPKAIAQCRDFISDENMSQIQLDIKEIRGNCYFGNVTVQTLPKRSSTLATTDFANSLKVVNEAVEVDFAEEIALIEKKYQNAHLNLKHIHSGYESLNGSVRSMSIHSRSAASSRASSIISGCTPSTIVASTVMRSEINGGRTQKQMKNQPKVDWNNLVPNGASGGVNQRLLPNNSQSLASSLVNSTAIVSEINGGATRMQMKNRLPNPAQSVADGSTVIQSEIDGGATRRQRNSHQNRQSFNANMANSNIRGNVDPNFIQQQRRVHMPAGYERDIQNFIKYNQCYD